MGDFLTRLAERALGLAPLFQPILPSTFAPQPRLASDFSLGEVLPPAEREETVEIQEPPVPASLEVASGPPSVRGNPSHPISPQSQDLSVPSSESRVAENPEKPAITADRASRPPGIRIQALLATQRRKPSPPATNAATDPQADAEQSHHVRDDDRGQGSAKTKYVSQEGQSSESRVAENPEKPAIGADRASRPPGIRIQALLATQRRKPSPPATNAATDPQADAEQSHHVRDDDRGQGSAKPQFVSQDGQSMESLGSGPRNFFPRPDSRAASSDRPAGRRSGNLVPSPDLRAAPVPVVRSLVREPLAPRAAPSIRVTIGRVEVKAIMPPAPPARPPSASRHAPTLSLEDYLKRRNGGER